MSFSKSFSIFEWKTHFFGILTIQNFAENYFTVQ